MGLPYNTLCFFAPSQQTHMAASHAPTEGALESTASAVRTHSPCITHRTCHFPPSLLNCLRLLKAPEQQQYPSRASTHGAVPEEHCLRRLHHGEAESQVPVLHVVKVDLWSAKKSEDAMNACTGMSSNRSEPLAQTSLTKVHPVHVEDANTAPAG